MTLQKLDSAITAAQKRALKEGFTGFMYSIIPDFGGREGNHVLHCKDRQGKEFIQAI